MERKDLFHPLSLSSLDRLSAEMLDLNFGFFFNQIQILTKGKKELLSPKVFFKSEPSFNNNPNFVDLIFKTLVLH